MNDAVQYEFDHLPIRGASMSALRWKRPKTWTAGLKFQRPAAARLAVTHVACERLFRISNSIAAWEKDLVAAAAKAIDAEREKRGKASWPKDLIPELSNRARMLVQVQLNEYHEERVLDALGVASVRTAADRAVARLLVKLRDQTRRGAPFGRGILPVVTMRLECGLTYDTPIRVSPAQGGVWLALPLVGEGWVGADIETAGRASYCELALLDRGWWIRFIYSSEPDVSERKPRPMRKTKTQGENGDGF
jgi:hypothetical protein